LTESKNPIYAGINSIITNERFHMESRAIDNEEEIFAIADIHRRNSYQVVNIHQFIRPDGAAPLVSGQKESKFGKRLLKRVSLQ
jgi:hypothetical protein